MPRLSDVCNLRLVLHNKEYELLCELYSLKGLSAPEQQKLLPFANIQQLVSSLDEISNRIDDLNKQIVAFREQTLPFVFVPKVAAIAQKHLTPNQALMFTRYTLVS